MPEPGEQDSQIRRAVSSPTITVLDLLERVKHTGEHGETAQGPTALVIHALETFGYLDPAHVILDPTTHVSDAGSLRKDSTMTVGIAPLDEDARVRRLYRDKEYTYQDEIAHRTFHELIHRVLNIQFILEFSGQSGQPFLMPFLEEHRKRIVATGKTFTRLPQLPVYLRMEQEAKYEILQNGGIRALEDLVELTTLFATKRDFFEDYVTNFLTRDDVDQERRRLRLFTFDSQGKMQQTLREVIRNTLIRPAQYMIAHPNGYRAFARQMKGND